VSTDAPFIFTSGMDGHRRTGADRSAAAAVLSGVPEGHALHVSSYAIGIVAKFMCYALAAMALDLVWGYTGILSLGHGVFFALGAYAHGMYLMRAIGRDGVYQSDLPDFMVFLDWKTYPWYWSLTIISGIAWRWWCWCPVCWRSSLAISLSVPESKACIFPSSRKP
jgi:ABC-type branched-subunit amino acid transport system permease subunit